MDILYYLIGLLQGSNDYAISLRVPTLEVHSNCLGECLATVLRFEYGMMREFIDERVVRSSSSQTWLLVRFRSY